MYTIWSFKKKVFNVGHLTCHVDWRLWFGPGVRLPLEALHPRSGYPVVPITGAAARSQGENSTVLHPHFIRNTFAILFIYVVTPSWLIVVCPVIYFQEKKRLWDPNTTETPFEFYSIWFTPEVPNPRAVDRYRAAEVLLPGREIAVNLL